jgi:putative spermidine/putrescine transport system ATP-binding protein
VPDEFCELRLVDLKKTFGNESGSQVTALAGLSLTVRRGEFVALLGPSGSGKSTALSCIAGLSPLSGGSIWLDERRIDTLPPDKRGFGVVFQDYALFPHMTVRQNIGFGLAMRRVPTARVRRRVDEALALVQLQGQGDKLPAQLSGGQQQRVAIARAIAMSPPLVLMDEPLSNLDPQLRLETRDEVRRIHRELGQTTIHVTHDREEALFLADRIVVLSGGTVQQVAPAHEVYAQPANLRVARFMGYRNVIAFEAEPAAHAAPVKLRREGLSLTGTAKQSINGERVMAAIRPEDIAVGEPHTANRLDGAVASVSYGGLGSLIEVSLAHDVRLHVRTPARVSIGDRLALYVPPERVLVYPAEGNGITDSAH